jgi:hypothetical protein
MHNPCIRGRIGYYGHFYKEQLRPTLKRIDAYVIKFKRMRHQTKGARDFVRPVPPGEPAFLCPLGPMPWQRPNIRSRVNREVLHGSGSARR